MLLLKRMLPLIPMRPSWLPKQKSVKTLTGQLEVDKTRVGELGVQTGTTNEDIEDTTAALTEDEKFLLELEKWCYTRTTEWVEVNETRKE